MEKVHQDLEKFDGGEIISKIKIEDSWDERCIGGKTGKNQKDIFGRTTSHSEPQNEGKLPKGKKCPENGGSCVIAEYDNKKRKH